MTDSIPPESLQDLFVDLDFISSAMIGQKPCFKNRYYVSGDSYVGYWLRRLDGENQGVNGNSKINSICRNASESYLSYGNNVYYGSALLDKIVEARKGLDRIRSTYRNLNQISTVSSINNSILILDNVIPKDRKIFEGFLKGPASIKINNDNFLIDNVTPFKNVRIDDIRDDNVKTEYIKSEPIKIKNDIETRVSFETGDDFNNKSDSSISFS